VQARKRANACDCEVRGPWHLATQGRDDDEDEEGVVRCKGIEDVMPVQGSLRGWLGDRGA